MEVNLSSRLDPTDDGSSVDTSLTFGRGADLDVDSNPFLHRRVGRFVFSDGIWWVENLDDTSPIRIRTGRTSIILAGLDRVPLTRRHTVICFQGGPCNYEIQVHLDRVPDLPPQQDAPAGDTATLRPGRVPLNDEQLLLLAALAEPWLKDVHYEGRMPTNRSVAARLGWTDAKFNRKLDYLCMHLDRQGIRGLRGSRSRALERRYRLVEHMIATEQLTTDHLVLLHEHDSRTSKHQETMSGSALGTPRQDLRDPTFVRQSERTTIGESRSPTGVSR